MVSFDVENGTVTIKGELAAGDYHPAGSPVKIRVDEHGAARIIDGELANGAHRLGGAYADLIPGMGGLASALPHDPADDQDEDDLSTWTVKQLRDYATAERIDLAGATRKGDLISAIEADVKLEPAGVPA